MHDADPGAYQGWLNDLLWLYRRIVALSVRHPGFSLAQVDGLIEDFERRWFDLGRSADWPAYYRYLRAWQLGDLDTAQDYHDRLATARRDAYSPCRGCLPDFLAEWRVARGDDVGAIALCTPVVEGRLGCVSQPADAYATLVGPLFRTGQPDRAQHAFKAGYRDHRDRLVKTAAIGGYLRYLAASQQLARGLEVLRRHLDWLDRAPTPQAELGLAAGGAILLDALGAAGRGETPFQDTTVGQAAAALRSRAFGLAGQFDTRNGTGYQSSRLRSDLK